MNVNHKLLFASNNKGKKKGNRSRGMVPQKNGSLSISSDD